MRQGSLFEFFNPGGQGTDHDHDTLDIARGQWSKNMTMTIENLNINAMVMHHGQRAKF